MHLVHQPGAEDHLDLTGVAEAAFDAVQFADGLFVHLAVVHQHQAQARGAVGGAGDILFTAKQRQQRVGGCGNVHVVPLLNKNAAAPFAAQRRESMSEEILESGAHAVTLIVVAVGYLVVGVGLQQRHIGA